MMAQNLENILSKVLRKITPIQLEREKVLTVANEVKQRVRQAIRKANLKAKISIDGSVAKDTWLKESPDIDIFIQVPTTVSREDFGTVYLEIAKIATIGAEQIERFAEHPYLEAILNGIRINIVPCYKVKKGEWKSATDRTPFHTQYVRSLLDERLCGEIRLLKKFMQGIGVYGAEIMIGGFSGYLCELLVLYYGSFIKVLGSSSDWMAQTFIDLEQHHREPEGDGKRLFNNPLVIIDPIDKRRNAASAVRPERLDEFISASRAFIHSPSKRFFYPPEREPFSKGRLLNEFKRRCTSMIFIKFGKVDAVSDVFWGQLYKSQRVLQKLVKQHDFEILRDTAWSDGRNLNLFLLEVEHRHLPLPRKHLGPPLEKKNACNNFLQKHVDSPLTLSGPRIEKGRWLVEVKRKHTDLVELLRTSLGDGGKKVGIAGLISQAIARDLELAVNEEIMPTYLTSLDFSKFLSEYIRGRPMWLDSTKE